MKQASKAPTHVFFIFHSGELAAWSVTPPKSTQRLLLSGEKALSINSSHALTEGFNDALARLRGKGETANFIHWITANSETEQLLKTNLLNKETPWQILSWAWLSQRFALEQAPLVDASLLESQIFPWLVTANKAKERESLQEALAKEHQTESERLAAERAGLQVQNEQLKVQNAALQNVDAENLVRFLPALFPRVFTILGAADLALLCGRVEPLAIRNPYPEPSDETLHVLQKDFRSLPNTLQKQIVGLVARLPQRQQLKPRPEMRSLIAELEED